MAHRAIQWESGTSLVCKEVLWLADKDLLLQPCLFAVLCPGTSHVNSYSPFCIFIWIPHKTKAVAAFLVVCCFLSCRCPAANDIKKQAKPAKPPADNLNKKKEIAYYFTVEFSCSLCAESQTSCGTVVVQTTVLVTPWVWRLWLRRLITCSSLLVAIDTITWISMWNIL